MQIASLKVRNYRVFESLDLIDLPPLAIFVGANGTGKSTLFDVFAFLRDALRDNVRMALTKRGGFQEVRTRERDGPIEIELKFGLDISGRRRLVTYHVEIGCRGNDPFVAREYLRYKRGRFGAPYHFLDFEGGQGSAVVNEEMFDEPDKPLEREEQNLGSPDILAIKGLGQFDRFKAANAFRQLIENWYLSDFYISEARLSPEIGHALHLSEQGENLALVAQYMYSEHRERFEQVLNSMGHAVPGVGKIDIEETIDGRLVLKFADSAFRDPFIARYVSDGTIKMFAYLLLINDPNPHPLLCIEEPENQLYLTLLGNLIEELRNYAERGGGQVFVSTHSPDALDAARPDEIFWFHKNHGVTTARRVKNDSQLVEEFHFGNPLGFMWRSGALEGVHPE